MSPAGGLVARLAERSDMGLVPAHARFARLSVLQAGIVPPNPPGAARAPGLCRPARSGPEEFDMTLVDTAGG